MPNTSVGRENFSNPFHWALKADRTLMDITSDIEVQQIFIIL